MSKALASLQVVKAKKLEHSDGSIWRKKLGDFCHQHGLRMIDVMRALSEAQSPWLDALPEREATGFIANTLVRPDAVCMEVSQSVDRMRKGFNGVVCALLPQGRQILRPPLVQRARPLHGIERMQLQGFPRQLVEDVMSRKSTITEALLTDLAGNAFSGSIAAVLVLAIVLKMPTHRVEWCAGLSAACSQGPQRALALADKEVEEENYDDYIARVL